MSTVHDAPRGEAHSETTGREAALARRSALIGVALTPLGVFGPLEWVWVVSLGLAGLAIGIARPSADQVRDGMLFLAFAGWVTLGLLWSDYRSDALHLVLGIWTAATIYLAVRSTTDGQLLPILRRIAMVWIVALATGMMLLWFVVDGYNTIANDTPVRHAAMAIAALTTVVLATRRTPALAIGIALVGLAAAVATGSRAAFGVIAAIIAVSLATGRRRSPLLVVAAAALAIVTVGLLPTVSEPASEFVTDVVERGLSGSNRPDIWVSVWDSCGISVFGSGIGTSNVLAERFHNGFPDPHNEFIRFACDTGIVGSLLLWSFFGVAIWHTARLLRRRPGNRLALSALLALGSVLVFSLVWNPITAAEFMVPVMVLVALADHAAERVRQTDHRPLPTDYAQE